MVEAANRRSVCSGVRAADFFAGLGGFTEGAEQAGCDVIYAANHWPEAVEIHSLNHKRTTHVCQDLQQADWREVPSFDLLLASPACQGHSPARGKERPHHDATRSTAWAVIAALEYHLPELAWIENVQAFVQWKLFPAWCAAVTALGYAISPHLVDAADFGVPQNRKRVFIALTKSKHPIQLQLPAREPVPASSFIDFGSGQWTSIERPGRAAATLSRIAAGRRVFGDRFVAPYFGRGSGQTGRSILRPIGTITTRDRWAVIDGDRMRMLSVAEARIAMGFPAQYRLPRQHRAAMHMLGNAVCPPVARDLIAALVAAA
ncbi:DNA cytosine methyltransferase [uncultured Stenotrophomonas sp.]|uniref:DNA cytosine methyltransferase n=1 Tax=uncultured Stenotrophomonas sp. TaxID=165438 RepID=UPI0025FDB1EF|nr:DNA cytosine methyltransferase [uncultured Stenotrophomonas sp.]